MQRLKQFISASTLVDEVVRKIRNPLNALLLNIENLEDEIAGIASVRMRNTVAALASILCEILRFSGLPKPRITAIDVNALAGDL